MNLLECKSVTFSVNAPLCFRVGPLPNLLIRQETNSENDIQKQFI